MRESVTLAGVAERARVARSFVGGVRGPGHPCGDVAVLLASELCGNSVLHSGSGFPGESVPVAVKAWDGPVRVEVVDCGGPGVPRLRPAVADAEGGRGPGTGGQPGRRVGLAAARRPDRDRFVLRHA